MPKATRKSNKEEETEPVPSQVINPQEAEEHCQNLEDALKELQRCANEDEVQEIIKSFIET